MMLWKVRRMGSQFVDVKLVQLRSQANFEAPPRAGSANATSAALGRDRFQLSLCVCLSFHGWGLWSGGPYTL